MGLSIARPEDHDVLITYERQNVDFSLYERLKHKLETEVAPLSVLGVSVESAGTFEVKSMHSGTVFHSRARGDPDDRLWRLVDDVALDYYKHRVAPNKQRQSAAAGGVSHAAGAGAALGVGHGGVMDEGQGKQAPAPSRGCVCDP